MMATTISTMRCFAMPMCHPSRIALLTGRYPFRYGLQTAVIPQGHVLLGGPTLKSDIPAPEPGPAQ